jgi:hypothetical protein
MTVDEIYQWVNLELNKSQTGGTLNPEEFNLALKWANQQYFKTKYGLPETYTPGTPLPPQAWSITQENIDALSPFLKGKGGRDYPALKVDIDGRASIPPDYVHVSSVRYGNKAVEVLSNDVLGDRLSSALVYPSEKYPICTFYGGYIQFHPVSLGFVNFDYLRMPETPVWAYTVVNDQAVYNSNASIQLEWNPIYHIDIANLTLQYAANNLRDQLAMQMANNVKIQGQ